jgi:hypothetical protein
VRVTVLEQRLTSQAFDLALHPVFDTQAAAGRLAELAAGDRRALERVLHRLEAVAIPHGRVTERIVAALRAALDALDASSRPGALAAAFPRPPDAIEPV